MFFMSIGFLLKPHSGGYNAATDACRSTKITQSRHRRIQLSFVAVCVCVFLFACVVCTCSINIIIRNVTK